MKVSIKSVPVVLVLSVLIISSCRLNDGPEPFNELEQFEKELDQIDAYLLFNDIDAEIDTIRASFIRYVINDPGVGDSAVDTDNINIDYEGRFMSTEAVFDSGDSVVFTLNRLIPAWRIMIPFIKEGGSITFYAPSYFCYGNTGASTIPPNSTLIFDVKLNRIE